MKAVKNFNIVILYFLLLTNLCFSQKDKTNVVGKIKVERNDNYLTLRAEALNLESFFVDELNYNLVAVKTSSTNNLAKNNQSGEFSLSPKEEKKLSALKVNLNEGDELNAYLFIKLKDELIHRDTLFLSTKVRKKKVEEFDFAIKGIVTNDAITNIGREFHDLFYKEYVVSNRKYPFVINIKEKPAMGRSSIVYIEVEGNKIHEFFAKPEEDYLKQNVVQTMRSLMTYAIRRQSIRRI